MTKRRLVLIGALIALLVVPATVAADTPLIVGDVSQDGMVNVADVIQIMQYTVGMRQFDADQLRCGDTTADGQVTVGDAVHIMQFTVDPDGTHGVLAKPLYDPVFHAGMIDPLTL